MMIKRLKDLKILRFLILNLLISILLISNSYSQELKFKFETGDYVSSSPAISQDGTIYFGSYDSYFYALKTDSYGLAKSNWPKFRGSLQNTGNVSYVAVTPKPKFPPNLIVSVKFIDEDGNNFLDAEEKGKIIVNIANKGEGEAYQVSVVLKPEITNYQLPI
jgi:outer membrane protein assembly factor BamB